jgi:hypothetical protein
MSAATSLREAVRLRANERCEYCRRPDSSSALRFAIDHIMARQHGGTDQMENLAWACPSCNRRKGPNVAGIDPESGRVVALYNPRMDKWTDHFAFISETIISPTPVGRATIAVLGLNLAHQIDIRRSLFRDGLMGIE